MNPWAPDGNPEKELRAWSSPLLSDADSLAQRTVENKNAMLSSYQEGVDKLTAECAKKNGPYVLPPYLTFVVAEPPEFSIETHPHLTCLKKHLPCAYADQLTNEKEDVTKLLAKVKKFLVQLKSDNDRENLLFFDSSSPEYVGHKVSKELWMQVETEACRPLCMYEGFLSTRKLVKSIVNETGISLEDLGLLWVSVGAAEDDCLSNKADFLPTLKRILDQYQISATVECLRHGSSLLQTAAEADLADVFRFLLRRIQDEAAAAAAPAAASAAPGVAAPTDLTSILTRRNRFGDTILIGCIRECVPDIVRLLLCENELVAPEQVRAFINLTNQTGQNCLSMAALTVSGYYCQESSEEDKELKGAEMFKLCVDAGVDLNLQNPSNGDTAFLKLCRYHNGSRDKDGASSRAMEICLQYLLEESPRRGEVNFTLKRDKRKGPGEQYGTWGRTVVEEILDNPNAEARRLVLAAAAQREDRLPGSGDPTNMLQISRKKASAPRGGLFGFGGSMMGRHSPRSDPPPAGTLVRGTKVTLQGLVGRADLNGRIATLVRFGNASGRWACKLVAEEGETAAAEAAAAGGGAVEKKASGDMVNVKATNLEPVTEEEPPGGRWTQHRLPSRTRILRHRNGAEIADAGDLVAPTFFGYSCEATCGAVHPPVVITDLHNPPPRPPTPRCPCVERARPCLGSCPVRCSNKNPHNTVVLQDGIELCTGAVSSDATACAMAHLPVVKSLTLKQLSARYDLACIERWGDSMGGEHEVVDEEEDDDDDEDNGEAKKGTVSLRQLLYGEGYHGYFEGCTGCGGDGTQRFCFCMNRAVNSNYVNHCFSCGKCFYTRHGTMRCSHCKALEPGTEEYFGREEESKWAWEIPDEMEAGLASEGYWGF
jgi:hypothetical protein